ncbi:SufS family cysteine desulfurase [Candidatus Pacearchaeota archaeon]|nr:SufS family cysteine desulfurase [Candidatus Pacearchaeota archaeon]
MKLNNTTAKKLKRDFPIFKNNPGLIYLDSAATSQRPEIVIRAVDNFIRKENANISRGVYTLAEKATEDYEQSRKSVAKFINAHHEEIVFTKNATEAINLFSYTLKSISPREKNEILLTEMEHHSNLVPWQQMVKRENMELKFIKVKGDFTLDLEDAKNKITDKTAILSFAHVSNVLGTINPVKELIKIARQKNKEIITIVDGAQSVQNIKIDVKKLDCDFLVFSGHKMLGPTGVGILYGKKELLEKMKPFNFGGGMIKKVTLKDAEWANTPYKFEAGTQNIVEVIALSEAIKYIENIGLENIHEWEEELTDYVIKKMREIPEIEIYHPKEKSAGIISFNLSGVHPHDIASLLNDYKICVRAGHHCAMPLMEKLKIPHGGTCRISFYIYNTFEDIDRLVEALKEINKKFNK